MTEELRNKEVTCIFFDTVLHDHLCTEVLVNRGFDVNTRITAEGPTPLHIDIKEITKPHQDNLILQSVNLLLVNGADPQSKEKDIYKMTDYTPLEDRLLCMNLKRQSWKQ